MLGSPVIEEYSLTPVQQGMLFHHLEGRNLGVDIEQFVGRLDEDVDAAAMRAAWQRVADRHPIMRTRFRWADRDEPVQEVVDHVDVALAVDDLRHLTPAEQEERLARFLVDDRRVGFDLDTAPLWRLTLFRLGPAREQFVFTYHHSLLDTSVVWMTEEAFRSYDASRRGEVAELVERRPYKDHIEWLHAHLAEDRPAAQAYYAALLEGFESPTQLLSLEGTEEVGGDEDEYGALRFMLPADVSGRFHAFTETHQLGGSVLVEAAWGLVLAAFAGTADVVFGSTRGCRRSGVAGSESIMGLFINTPPVRVTIDPGQPVVELLRRGRAQQVDKRAHEHTALSDIQAVAETRPSALFDTIVVVNDRHQGTRLTELGGPFESRHFDLHDQTNFPLTLLAYLDPHAHFKLSYDRRRFTAAAMQRVRDLLVEVLTAIVDHADAPVAELPRVPDGELGVMKAWNAATARDYPSGACVHELFEAQVDLTPDAIALVHRAQRLTYRELDERANAVAAHLRELGAGPDAMVGIFIERSAEMVVGLLGILKAGAAYVPMDPAYPSVRIGMMLEDSHADIVLTHSRLADSVDSVGDGTRTSAQSVVALDTFEGRRAARVVVPELRSDHLAYVIFTSGSTGRPKGVMIEHRNVANFFTAMDEQLDFTPGVTAPGTWLAVTSISFDISVLELFWTLTRGFTVVVQDDEGRLSTETSAAPRAPAKGIAFSLFYFAADAGGTQRDRYRLLLEGAKFADAHGFAAVWTPERHFHEFGGLYPNPALTSAAVAVVTEHVEIRAGSVVLPLHNPIRVAEDWSVVDNLSNGRVGLSFASGWHANDFALAPDNFERRRELMAEGIETVRALWRGESVPTRSGDGREIEVRMFPPPVQHAPKMWITAGGSPATFTMAGTLGASILTNLLVMGQDDLVANVAAYREAYRAAGHPGDGHVTVMLHTFVGRDADEVRALVREPFLDYLRSSTDLINKVQWETTSFAKPGQAEVDGSPAGGPARLAPGGASVPDLDDLDPDEIAVIMDHAFARYVGSAGLFGTPESCLAQVDRLRDLGVDEIACLIDFGVDQDVVLANLENLDELRRAANAGSGAVEAPAASTLDHDIDEVDLGFVAQVGRHGVTHVQCTPSMAAVIAADRSGLGALASLEQLLLGGEALPPPLVDEIRPALAGRLLNMYGPTETTIWSTVAPIERDGAPITIGRPIANTQVYVVDGNLQLNPIGAAGELLIGGEGVVRGYLDRPELTTERFVHLAAADGERVYRTGDLVTLLPDGELQFSGRLDHQVKVRGYRIELGEIEAVIGRFPNVRENVVVARTDTPGDPRLVAYVVAGSDGDAAEPLARSETRSAHTLGAEAWGEVWDEIYGAGETDDPTFDTSGWNDSYTGDPIPAEQMHEWVDGTVARIRELAPRRVLEIGCGTGLLLFRIAPHCERYVGVDLAQHGIDRIAAALPGAGLTNVELRRGAAHDVISLAAGSFDTIVINSVAQYFPDAGYLVDVITTAVGLLEPGGSLFVGDVRSRDHQPLFAAAIELARAPASMAASELASRVAHREAGDEELVVDPGLFHALAARHPDIADVDVRIKPGRSGNEMTRFRYDVVIHKTGGAPAPVAAVQELALERLSVFAVRDALAAEPAVLRITGLRNDRLVREHELVRLLAEDPAGTVADVRTALGAVPAGDHPDDLDDVDDIDDRYEVAATWSTGGVDRFDILLRAKKARARIPAPAVDASRPWSAYTNEPARRDAKTLAPELRAHLRSSLPDHMVPTAFVLLDALPRTPNGKIDRNALPAPDRGRVEDAEVLVAPASDIEVTIATIWQDILSLDAVGVETNLFDLGANSLMMVRASSRLGEALGRKVSLVEMFGYPTVRSLAAHLGGGEGDTALSQSQERAEARREAMRRRQEARAGRRR
jgi:natural product biosynthesis luciferase-like monooxygenase protein